MQKQITFLSDDFPDSIEFGGEDLTFNYKDGDSPDKKIKEIEKVAKKNGIPTEACYFEIGKRYQITFTKHTFTYLDPVVIGDFEDGFFKGATGKVVSSLKDRVYEVELEGGRTVTIGEDYLTLDK